MPLYEKNNYPIEEYDQNKNPLKVTIHNTHIETDEAFYDLTEKFNQIKLINCTSPARLMSHVDVEIMDSQLNVFDIEPKDLDIPAKVRNECIITNTKLKNFITREDTISWVGDNSELENVMCHGYITFGPGSRTKNAVIDETGEAYIKDSAVIEMLHVRGTVTLDNCDVKTCRIYPGGRVKKLHNCKVKFIRAEAGRNFWSEVHTVRRKTDNQPIRQDYIVG